MFYYVYFCTRKTYNILAMKKTLLLLLCMTALLSGRAFADVGDTISYCGNSAFQTRIGVNNTTSTVYWGVMFPATQLAGRDSIMSVEMFMTPNDTGVYHLTIYEGGTTAPQTQLLTQTYTLNSSFLTTAGYVSFTLGSHVAIPANQNIWIIFDNTDALYPASACAYVGNSNSNWLSLDGASWSHCGTEVGLTQDFSWLIKCVTHASSAALPVVMATGPTSAAVGEQLTFTASASSGATVSWQLNGGTPSSATGNTATATWNTPGTYNVIATASNSNGTARDTVVLTVYNCSEITSFPYTMGFEANDPIACWTILDADGDGYAWDAGIFSNATQAHTGEGCIGSASYINNVGALEPDNWLVSPHIYLPQDNGFTLSWFASGVDQTYYAEHYGVYISTTGMNPADFTLLQEYDIASNTWTQQSVSLDQYAGQHVYIAFRHFDIEDMYWMKLDDISITMQQPSTYSVSFVCEGAVVGHVSTQENGSGNSLCGEQLYLSSEQVTNLYIRCQKFEYHLEALYVNDVNHIGDVSLQSGDIEDVYVYAFQPVEQSVVRAVFAGREITITVTANPPDGGEVFGGGTYHYLDTAVLEAHPNPGYVFTGWNDGNANATRRVVATANVTYTAIFNASNGIMEQDGQSAMLNLYPNPVSDFVTVEIKNIQNRTYGVEITIVDLNGRTCLSERYVSSGADGMYRIDVSSLVRGIYYVRIKGGEINKVCKIVKQ